MKIETLAAGGGGGTNSFRNNRNEEYKKGLSLNMFKPSDSDKTPDMGDLRKRLIIPLS